MSVRLCNLVWKNFHLEGGNLKLALMALADYANDVNGKIFPSVVTFAAKIACSESAARRALHRLIDLNVVRVVANHNGGRPGMPRHYQIDTEGLKAGLYLRPEPARRVASTPAVKRPRRLAPTLGVAAPGAEEKLSTRLASTRETASVHDTLTTINHQPQPAKTTGGGVSAGDDENRDEQANAFARQYGGATWH
jgi:hypothetical protein